jgi:hypothetical protein
MPAARQGFLRDNAFIVAAIALPVVVAAFFLLATAIPQWTVPGPQYDLVFRAARPYTSPPLPVLMDVAVRDGAVVAVVRSAPPNTYPQPWAVFLYEHETGTVEELRLDIPTAMTADEAPRTIPVGGLDGRRISPQTRAPDGYELQTRTSGNTGLVGDLFGMGRYRQSAVLINRGRVIPIELPSPFQDPYQSQVVAVGWIVDGDR